VTRKSIQTNAAVVTCDVCGRTLLRGEQSDVFLHGGQRRNVCELCTTRAVHEGWIREGLDDAQVRRRDGRRGQPSLLARLRQRRAEQGGGGHADDGLEPAADVVPVHSPVAPSPRTDAPVADEEEPLYPPRSVHSVPTNADLKVARALEVFNGGAHIRTVAGVARSLGAPIVSARPSATEGSVVTIVVAWELSWYRYEVDLADEAAGVRVVAQGAELGDLEIADQTPNAAADEAGQLHPAASLA
jgi:hypothetical protein